MFQEARPFKLFVDTHGAIIMNCDNHSIDAAERVAKRISHGNLVQVVVTKRTKASE